MIAEVRQVSSTSVIPSHLDGVESSGKGDDPVEDRCVSWWRWVRGSCADLLLRECSVQPFEVEDRDVKSVAHLL